MSEQSLGNQGMRMYITLLTGISEAFPELIWLMNETKLEPYYRDLVDREINFDDRVCMINPDNECAQAIRIKLQANGIPFVETPSTESLKPLGNYVFVCRATDYENIQMAMKELEMELEEERRKQEEQSEEEDKERELSSDEEEYGANDVAEAEGLEGTDENSDEGEDSDDEGETGGSSSKSKGASSDSGASYVPPVSGSQGEDSYNSQPYEQQKEERPKEEDYEQKYEDLTNHEDRYDDLQKMEEEKKREDEKRQQQERDRENLKAEQERRDSQQKQEETDRREQEQQQQQPAVEPEHEEKRASEQSETERTERNRQASGQQTPQWESWEQNIVDTLNAEMEEESETPSPDTQESRRERRKAGGYDYDREAIKYSSISDADIQRVKDETNRRQEETERTLETAARTAESERQAAGTGSEERNAQRTTEEEYRETASQTRETQGGETGHDTASETTSYRQESRDTYAGQGYEEREEEQYSSGEAERRDSAAEATSYRQESRDTYAGQGYNEREEEQYSSGEAERRDSAPETTSYRQESRDTYADQGHEERKEEPYPSSGAESRTQSGSGEARYQTMQGEQPRYDTAGAGYEDKDNRDVSETGAGGREHYREDAGREGAGGEGTPGRGESATPHQTASLDLSTHGRDEGEPERQDEEHTGGGNGSGTAARETGARGSASQATAYNADTQEKAFSETSDRGYGGSEGTESRTGTDVERTAFESTRQQAEQGEERDSGEGSGKANGPVSLGTAAQNREYIHEQERTVVNEQEGGALDSGKSTASQNNVPKLNLEMVKNVKSTPLKDNIDLNAAFNLLDNAREYSEKYQTPADMNTTGQHIFSQDTGNGRTDYTGEATLKNTLFRQREYSVMHRVVSSQTAQRLKESLKHIAISTVFNEETDAGREISGAYMALSPYAMIMRNKVINARNIEINKEIRLTLNQCASVYSALYGVDINEAVQKLKDMAIGEEGASLYDIQNFVKQINGRGLAETIRALDEKQWKEFVSSLNISKELKDKLQDMKVTDLTLRKTRQLLKEFGNNPNDVGILQLLHSAGTLKINPAGLMRQFRRSSTFLLNRLGRDSDAMQAFNQITQGGRYVYKALKSFTRLGKDVTNKISKSLNKHGYMSDVTFNKIDMLTKPGKHTVNSAKSSIQQRLSATRFGRSHMIGHSKGGEMITRRASNSLFHKFATSKLGTFLSSKFGIFEMGTGVTGAAGAGAGTAGAAGAAGAAAGAAGAAGGAAAGGAAAGAAGGGAAAAGTVGLPLIVIILIVVIVVFLILWAISGTSGSDSEDDESGMSPYITAQNTDLLLEIYNELEAKNEEFIEEINDASRQRITYSNMGGFTVNNDTTGYESGAYAIVFRDQYGNELEPTHVDLNNTKAIIAMATQFFKYPFENEDVEVTQLMTGGSNSEEDESEEDESEEDETEAGGDDITPDETLASLSLPFSILTAYADDGEGGGGDGEDEEELEPNDNPDDLALLQIKQHFKDYCYLLWAATHQITVEEYHPGNSEYSEFDNSELVTTLETGKCEMDGKTIWGDIDIETYGGKFGYVGKDGEVYLCPHCESINEKYGTGPNLCNNPSSDSTYMGWSIVPGATRTYIYCHERGYPYRDDGHPHSEPDEDTHPSIYYEICRDGDTTSWKENGSPSACKHTEYLWKYECNGHWGAVVYVTIGNLSRMTGFGAAEDVDYSKVGVYPSEDVTEASSEGESKDEEEEGEGANDDGQNTDEGNGDEDQGQDSGDPSDDDEQQEGDAGDNIDPDGGDSDT